MESRRGTPSGLKQKAGYDWDECYGGMRERAQAFHVHLNKQTRTKGKKPKACLGKEKKGKEGMEEENQCILAHRQTNTRYVEKS